MEKYIFNDWQILCQFGHTYFAIWINIFAIWTNTFCNLDKYILQFGQINLAIWTTAFLENKCTSYMPHFHLQHRCIKHTTRRNNCTCWRCQTSSQAFWHWWKQSLREGLRPWAEDIQHTVWLSVLLQLHLWPHGGAMVERRQTVHLGERGQLL